MAVTIRSNISSLRAQRSLTDASDKLSASTTRLASGFRINSAADDAAGLAIATQLNSSSRVYNQGMRNINDGMSVLNIAEGALLELSSITTRQKELAEQAANGVYSNKQRDALDKESLALTNEYNRIVASTKMNGVSLLDGTLLSGMRIQAGFGTNESISVSVGRALMGVVGDGTFAAQTTSPLTGAGRMFNGDLNNDGREDLVVLSANQPQVLLGNGDGTFKTAVSYAGGTTSANVHLADVDGDKNADILVADAFAVYVLMGNGDGTFKARRSYAGPQNGLGIQTGDVDGDGRVDLLVSDNTFGGSSQFLMLGNGDGSFKAATSFLILGQAGASIMADINRDGRLDFFSVDGTNQQLNVFIGNGDGTFKAKVTYAGGGTGSPLFTDLNGDGLGDFVAADASTNNITVLFGNGDGTFRAANTYFSGPSPFNLLAADLNGDGVADLVAANSGNSTASVFLNNGNGTFNAPVTLANALRIRLGDFNGDGVTDVVTTSTNTVGMYLGNGRSSPYITPVDLTTQQGARSALTTLDSLHTKITSELGNIGAFQQRLSTALRNLGTTKENFTAAESRIRDADIAYESANLVRNQILQQAATSVLAQANRAPELALSLLR